MAQWLYWVCFAMQREGRVALSGKVVEAKQAINSEEMVVALINDLTLSYYTDEELEQLEEGELPLVPLTWTLISAKQGPAVQVKGEPKH